MCKDCNNAITARGVCVCVGCVCVCLLYVQHRRVCVDFRELFTVSFQRVVLGGNGSIIRKSILANIVHSTLPVKGLYYTTNILNQNMYHIGKKV